MFKFNNSIVPIKVRIGWHCSSNKYAYRDTYSPLKSIDASNLAAIIKVKEPFLGNIKALMGLHAQGVILHCISLENAR